MQSTPRTQLQDFSILRLFPLSFKLLRRGAESFLCLLPLGEQDQEQDINVRLPQDFRERLAIAVDVSFRGLCLVVSTVVV